MVAPAAPVDLIASSRADTATAPPGASIRLSRFLPAVPEIVTAVLERIESDLPELRTAAWRGRAADEAMLLFELRRRLELCEQNRGFDDADLARFAAHFATMARRGAPLRTVQRFCRAAIAHTFTELWSRAEPGDVTELLRLSRWLSRHNGPVERLLVQTYCELLDPGRQHSDRRQALAERLLAGLAEESPAEPDLPLAPIYLVVVLTDATDAPGTDLPAGTLSAVTERTTHLLVPVEAAEARAQAWREMGRWAAARGGLRAAGVFAERPADVPVAADAARRLLHAAAAVGLPSGLVGARELVLESTLVHHPSGLRRLAAVLDPVDSDPRLVETLTTFFAHDLDRTRTSAALFLSRGGLSLRLDRIAQLTGLDPRSTRGIQVLGSALSARALLALPELGAGADAP
jgi:hypothetical protein